MRVQLARTIDYEVDIGEKDNVTNNIFMNDEVGVVDVHSAVSSIYNDVQTR